MRIGALSLLCWSMCATVAVAAIPRDQGGFTRYVADRLSHGAPRDSSVLVTQPLTLRLDSLTLNLDRIYAYCRADEAGCSGEVDRYIAGALETLQDQRGPVAREALRLVVRSASYVLEIQKSFDADAQLQSRPFVDGLFVVPVLDTPRTMRFLNAKDVQALGLSLDEIFAVAGSNTRATLPAGADAVPAAGPGQIGPLTGDNYESSLLLFPDYWASLAARQKGVLIASAPAKDVILYVSEDTPQALDALRALARDVMRRSAGPLSDRLLRWQDGAWAVLP